MFKNIIIIAALALLALTASPLTLVEAQKNRSEPKRIKPSADVPADVESADYHRITNERLAISALKSLYEAESRYMLTTGGGDFGTLTFLGQEGLIDPVLASGEKYGYIFSLEPRPGSMYDVPGFFVTATPRHYGRTGKRSFYMDGTCLLRGVDWEGTEADEYAPVIETCPPTISYHVEYDISIRMRIIQAAQERYFNGVGNYGTIDDLLDAELIDYFLFFNFDRWMTLEIIPPDGKTPAGFKLRGKPVIYREDGIRSYYAAESGILRAADLGGDWADENTPPLVFEDEELIKFAMRTLMLAQYRYTGVPGNGNGDFATDFDHLAKAGLIDFRPENGVYGNYRFEMSVQNHEEPHLRYFTITAVPLVYGQETRRSFYISNSSFLRGTDRGGLPADENDPLIEF
jgi:hypothetical protein